MSHVSFFAYELYFFLAMGKKCRVVRGGEQVRPCFNSRLFFAKYVHRNSRKGNFEMTCMGFYVCLIKQKMETGEKVTRDLLIKGKIRIYKCI